MSGDLRPASCAEFVGQVKQRTVLSLLVAAARKRGGCVPHVLLSGPPGLGKTTLARIVAAELQTRLIEVVASHLQSPDEMAAHLRGIREGDVFFIDEIHGLPRAVEEALYSAMEDFRLAIPQGGYDSMMKQLGIGTSKPTVQVIELPRFTVVGATTLAGLVSDPLRTRFVHQLVLEPYPHADMVAIVTGAAARMGLTIAPAVADGIASRSRQTARVAISHLRWLAEFCQATDQPPDTEAFDECMRLKDVDAEGLTRLDRQYLRALVDAEAPLGLTTLAAALNEPPDTIAEVIEPLLIRKGYVRKGPRGRVALPRAIAKVGAKEEFA